MPSQREKGMERGEEGAQCRQINSPFLPFFLCWGRTKAKEGGREERRILPPPRLVLSHFLGTKKPSLAEHASGFPLPCFCLPLLFSLFLPLRQGFDTRPTLLRGAAESYSVQRNAESE